jgi:hypothetical protein
MTALHWYDDPVRMVDTEEDDMMMMIVVIVFDFRK